MVVDDVTVFGKDCKKELEKSGFEVSLCKKDGNTVISLLENQHFDAVLMDVFMSGADGFEVLESISESLTEKPLTLVLSAVDNSQIEEQVIASGADYYFIKPVSPESVAKRIEKCLARSRNYCIPQLLKCIPQLRQELKEQSATLLRLRGTGEMLMFFLPISVIPFSLSAASLQIPNLLQ